MSAAGAGTAGTEHDFPGPVFVGGPGRSGTHPMGRLVAAHPRYYLIRTEARFHAVEAGLPGLLAGRVELDDFTKRFRGSWWKRGFGQKQGLQRVADRDQFDAALEEFEAGFPADPWGASRTLVKALLDPAAERAGKPSWVEVTGDTVENAPTLSRLFPRAKFINMVRDGRAVVAGHLKKSNLTDDPMAALDKWERMVRAAHDAISSMPDGAVIVVFLDDLVALNRERTYRRLVEFLEIDDDAPMRHYFDTEISAEAAHFGRWRERMPPPEARRVDRRYRRLVRRLHREGVSWAPAPPEAEPRPGRLRLTAALR